MRKLKSLEDFNQELTPEKTRMFQGGEGSPRDETFVGRDGDIQFEFITRVSVPTYVEVDGDSVNQYN